MLKICSPEEARNFFRKRKFSGQLQKVENTVREIIENVRQKGDAAVKEYTWQFDGVRLEALEVGKEEKKEAYREVSPKLLAALTRVKENIYAYHSRQLPHSQIWPDSKGNLVGWKWSPLERVGIYIPGGTALYPSSVLMSAVPALAAGVKEIVLLSPPAPDGNLPAEILVAAQEAGVKHMYKAGGAQAIAALAYGTETIMPADKIVGPGNIYVASAKKLVYGLVDIDMIAGPSEILIIADEKSQPKLIAADLLSQAEHDPDSLTVLLTPFRRIAEATCRELEKQLNRLPRKQLICQALQNYGLAVITSDLAQCLTLAEEIAPEHLELLVENPWKLADKLNKAGAIFIGENTPEPVGDYFAGPSHILPTGGTARFSSPLNVLSFLKRTSLINYSRSGLEEAAESIIELARAEKLLAHARAVQVRLAEEEEED